MTKPNLVVFYVDSLAASAAFYRDLLDREPAESSPNFVMFPLSGGMGLGLWARHAVEPAVLAGPGGAEVVFAAEDIDAVHRDWSSRGLRIAQPPTDMDFGRTFVALDPDGHRLRVFAPAAAWQSEGRHRPAPNS
ncbi:VOC family protein [Acidisoma sp. L85]|jgi:predicted enzyme related to lactoylglutathione lyase|uniref:VOC family protein n=2 Tax=unclassified Acidisoma TaxID=2634065 RepID=UPI00131EC27A|nr:VOC family protein [Acidisoma sp. L85]